jgi:shikimate kinase
MKRNIILIGFMGTGKTTIGRALIKRLNWGHVDTDQWIEEQEGLSIPDIFSKHGEQHFRDLESASLTTLLSREEQVITTGGGAVIRADNRERMLKNGIVVALFANVDTILERVHHDKNRPLLQGDAEGKIRLLMDQREGMYNFAHIHLHTDGKDLNRLTDELLSKLQEYDEWSCLNG